MAKTMERLSEGCVTKAVLDFIGMTVPEYKSINPEAAMFKKATLANSSDKGKEQTPKVTNPVLSNRVKTLEETVSNVPKDKDKKDSIDNDDSKVSEHEGHAHNDMLSPYSNVPVKAKTSKSKSPSKRALNTEDKDNKNNLNSSTKLGNCDNNNSTLIQKDITDYITSRGQILYPELLSDEIAKVDEKLLKSCKKEGQVGGEYNICYTNI